MQSRKQKEIEYHQAYDNIPKDYNERLTYMSESYRLSGNAMESIIDRRNNMINNIYFNDIYIALYMKPEGTPRHRYRLITPKNYMSVAAQCPYVHVYQPRAHEDHAYMKRLVDDDLVELKKFIQTPFACDIHAYFATPSNYSQSDKFMAEIGLDLNIKKPDVDNVEKKYLDMFNQNVWLDDNMCFSGRLTKLYSILPRVEIHIRYMNCAMNKFQYSHIVSRVGYKDDNTLYYLGKDGNPIKISKENKNEV